MQRKANFSIAFIFFCAFWSFQNARADSDTAPLIRSPGVNQQELDAYAEAHNRITFSKRLELSRPGQENEARLRQLMEKAQAAWLSGSLESARSEFKEITRLALDADWCESQREAIHYAFLRLAQLSATPIEQNEWLEKAVFAFPNIKPDSALFPPPLMASFRKTHVRLLALGKTYRPYGSFPGYQFILINGEKYDLNPDLEIHLPIAAFRVTAFSDTYAPLTEKLKLSQMQAFRISLPSLAAGSCDLPTSKYDFDQLKEIAILYPGDCVRTQNTSGWLSRNADLADVEKFSAGLQRPLQTSLDGQIHLPGPDIGAASPSRSSISIPHKWAWMGAAVLAVGAAYVLHEELLRRDSDGPVTPVQHQGF